MQTKIPDLVSKLRHTTGAHVLYLSDKQESYIRNAVIFILDGIRNGDYVLMIENPRLTPLIFQRLKGQVTEAELESVRFANNFEFYWKEGNFLPITIIEYFKKTLLAASLDGRFFRTWGHIEWGSQEGLEEEILTYDRKASQFISEQKIIAVCAYDAARVSESLQEQLRVRHSHLMEDDQIMSLTLLED